MGGHEKARSVLKVYKSQCILRDGRPCKHDWRSMERLKM